MVIFGPKPQVNPIWTNGHFSTFLILVYIAQKGFFSFQNIVKDIFLGYIAYEKKVGKIVIFGPKPQVNPLWTKWPFFDFLNSRFYSLERLFFVLEYCKRLFPGLYYLKKNLEKWRFLDQNQGLTPLEKCQFFEF